MTEEQFNPSSFANGGQATPQGPGYPRPSHPQGSEFGEAIALLASGLVNLIMGFTALRRITAARKAQQDQQ